MSNDNNTTTGTPDVPLMSAEDDTNNNTNDNVIQLVRPDERKNTTPKDTTPKFYVKWTADMQMDSFVVDAASEDEAKQMVLDIPTYDPTLTNVRIIKITEIKEH